MCVWLCVSKLPNSSNICWRGSCERFEIIFMLEYVSAWLKSIIYGMKVSYEWGCNWDWLIKYGWKIVWG